MELDKLLYSSNEENIKTYTKDYIVKNIVCGIGDVRWGFKVLILDQVSLRFIDAAVEMKEITKAGVSDVCLIDKDRLPLPKLDGIYFLSPTTSNVDRIVRDFDDGDNPKYRHVHLFFTARLNEDLMRKLGQARVMARIKTLKEVNLQYLVYDSLSFHFDSPKSLFHLYSQKGNQPNEQREIAERLASVMATLGEYPVIRYARSNANCAAIASLVHEQIEKFRRGGVLKAPGARGTLLVLDRTHDLISPVIHDLFYQPMIEDILSLASSTNTLSEKLHNDVYRYKYKDGEEKEQLREVILNEKDLIWREIRSMHIEAARTWITSNFKKFRDDHSDIGQGHDLTKQLRAMPKFQMLKSKFSVHISLAKECMDVYNRTGLERVCSVEQDLATGMTEEKKKVILHPNDLRPLLHDGNISTENKQRLLMLYHIADPKVAAESRSSLEKESMFTDVEEQLLTNWLTLREQTTRTIQQRPPQSDEEWEFVVSRYLPTLHDIILGLADTKLPTKDYPFLNKEEEGETRQTTSTTSQSKKKNLGPSWGASNEAQTNKKRGPKLIVFIAGGLSFSELRVAHRLTQKPYNLDVILGGTHIIDPPRFLKQVAALHSQSADHEAYKPSSSIQPSHV